MTALPLTFDGHNDFLLRLFREPQNRKRVWEGAAGGGQLDLRRMKAGGFAGGFFAIYMPSPQSFDDEEFQRMMRNPPYAVPLPPALPLEAAQPMALAMAGHLLWLERTGDLKICRSAAEIREAMHWGRIAAVMHMEGAEAIGPDLDALYVWREAGLRSLGPVWSRPTAFGHGVPFAFPSTPDTGPGLTPAGQDLVRLCEELKIMIDLSHLNEKGFDDVARLTSAPLVATHSNAHALTPSSRNLTDRQLRQIAERDGMVGLNFAVAFLRPDGRQDPDTPLEDMLRHLDHLMSILGEDRVGLGSDFDGAEIPARIADVAGLPNLWEACRRHGYGEALIDKLASKNWLALLERVWGE